ncbi:MarR family winged helix-turn-helix transcriptional regulator [Streptomyces sp. NRRL S-1448]|uniref:MarR family winged helix-turn-helix transcriptional regulator n=1 Tax=Streptomyces sp. NRRL S-1448 TaxID=1463883 RepID=UPI000A7F13E7|nr:MarR family winged helix-turn-helix transcriptional regulator [Streptomyces sp. NRRL S-1448]
MVALRRSRQRRAPARLAERRDERTDRHAGRPDAVFALLDVVASAAEQDAAPTVTEAAALLGVDRPRSSRLTAQAIEAGLLRREADQRDGRRSLLVPTPEGRDVLARIRGFRCRVIAVSTAGWSTEDRAALTRLLTRFVRDFEATTTGT